MNPQSDFDLLELKRLELLGHSEKTHHHNRLLGHRPQPGKMLSPLKNGLRAIPKLRYLRLRVRLEMIDPRPEASSY